MTGTRHIYGDNMLIVFQYYKYDLYYIGVPAVGGGG